jgi:uncharacterized membrane protein YphA (DoxX/SURF4 family)
MLSLFPSLLSYGPVAPLILRITLGVILLYWAYGRIKNRTSPLMTLFGVLEGAIGILFLIGFLTQLAALVAAVIFIVKLVGKIKARSFFTNGCKLLFHPSRYRPFPSSYRSWSFRY